MKSQFLTTFLMLCALVSAVNCTKPKAPPVTAPMGNNTSTPEAAELSETQGSPVTENLTTAQQPQSLATEEKMPNEANPPMAPKITLATLESFLPRVTFRRQSEVAWEEAMEQLPLFRFDAVRTHSKANAKITFTNGSTIDLNADSLLIINSSEPVASAVSIDKVLVRKGKLTAKTQKDLWVLTSAALYRFWPTKKSKVAQGILAIEEGKKASFELKQGEGMVMPLAPGKGKIAPAAMKLVVNKPIILAAPVAPSDFGESPQTDVWPEVAVVERKKRELASLPDTAPKPQATPADFIIQSPADYSEVFEAMTELKGKVLSGDGTLQVNGKTVAVNAKGEFRTKIKLNPGANAILIQWNVSQQTPVFRRWTIIRR